MRFAMLLLLMLLSGGAALAQTDRNLSTDQRVLAGTEWRLVSFGPPGGETAVITGTTVTLRFGEDERAGGSTGCNSYSGSYQVRGNNTSFSRLISTKRACLDQRANQQEQQYLAAIESANRFRLSSNRLTIFYNAGRGVLNFANESTSDPDDGQANDAVTALSSYYSAINSRDYGRAYRLWETPQSTLDQFERGFADTERVRLLVESPVRTEGAAGSLYADVPVVLLVRSRSGGDRLFAGCYVMRKSNLRDQDGGSSEAGWRIYRANISQVASSARLSNTLTRTCRR